MKLEKETRKESTIFGAEVEKNLPSLMDCPLLISARLDT